MALSLKLNYLQPRTVSSSITVDLINGLEESAENIRYLCGNIDTLIDLSYLCKRNKVSSEAFSVITGFNASNEGLGEALKKAWDWLIEKLKSFWNWIKSIWNKIFGSSSSSVDKKAKELDDKAKSDPKTKVDTDAAKNTAQDMNKLAETVEKEKEKLAHANPAEQTSSATGEEDDVRRFRTAIASYTATIKSRLSEVCGDMKAVMDKTSNELSKSFYITDVKLYVVTFAVDPQVFLGPDAVVKRNLIEANKLYFGSAASQLSQLDPKSCVKGFTTKVYGPPNYAGVSKHVILQNNDAVFKAIEQFKNTLESVITKNKNSDSQAWHKAMTACVQELVDISTSLTKIVDYTRNQITKMSMRTLFTN